MTSVSVLPMYPMPIFFEWPMPSYRSSSSCSGRSWPNLFLTAHADGDRRGARSKSEGRRRKGLGGARVEVPVQIGTDPRRSPSARSEMLPKREKARSCADRSPSAGAWTDALASAQGATLGASAAAGSGSRLRRLDVQPRCCLGPTPAILGCSLRQGLGWGVAILPRLVWG